MRYLPDTNLIITWVNGGNSAIVDRVTDRRHDIALSAIVFYELAFGAFKSGHVDRNLRQLEGLGLPLVAFDRADATAAGEVRATLSRQGRPIGPYDTLIAGQALARNMTLVTNNTREFSRVEGLRLEDWTISA